jgi:hypothetical protein
MAHDFQLTVRDGLPTRGRLTYSGHEFLFVELPGWEHPDGIAVVSVGTLQIHIDIATQLAMGVDGLSVRASWGDSTLAVPEIKPGEVVVEPIGFAFSSGVGYPYLDSANWNTTFDAVSGWICVGDDTASRASMITTDTALSIHDGVMTAVWLRPEMV